MSKVIDKKLNEYAMLLGWGMSGNDLGLSLGYAKINSDQNRRATHEMYRDIVVTKKLGNIQLCNVSINPHLKCTS